MILPIFRSVYTDISSYFSGYLYTSTGSYDAAFFVCGAVVAFSACLMFLIPWFISEERIITQEKVLLSDNSPGSDEKSKFFLHKTTLAIENTDKIINSKDKEISKLFFDSDRAMERLTAV